MGLGGLWVYNHFSYPPRQSKSWQNLPQGYQLVVYVPFFAQSWKAFRHSPLWNIWRESPHLGELFLVGQRWDSLLRKYPLLFEWLGGKGVLIALYPEGPLYLLEAPFLAKVGDWRGLMQRLVQQYGWPIDLVEREGYALWRLPEGYLVPAGTFLAYAAQPSLLSRFLRGDQVKVPPWNWGEETWGDTSPWLAIGWEGSALYQRLSHPALDFINYLKWGEIRFYLTEEGIVGEGSWIPTREFWDYTVPTSISIAELCPPNTQLLISLKLKDPVNFYRKYLLPNHEKEIKTAEKWLSISFEEQFFQHLSGEVGIAHSRHPFVLLRLKNPEAFGKSLSLLERRIRWRTPLTTRKTSYRGYTIHHIEVKALFKWLLGKAFSDWEAPYAVQVGEWLIAAKVIDPLHAWIDAYLSRRSLYEKADFSPQLSTISPNSLLIAYLQPNPAEWLQEWLSPTSYKSWQKELNPWQSLYFTLQSSTKSESLACRLQLLWKSFANGDTLPPPPTYSLPSFRDSSIEGTQEEYYPNGVLKRRVTYVEGQMEGEYWEYHPNGTVKVQGYYEQGQKVGKWRYFSSKGELLREENWGQEELSPSSESEK
ncbi:MAG: hypothetical protein RMJ66_04380 [Bacteroidia bacterium]|nr:hypothetical protein [Bacteroidia bacterium]